MANLKVRIFKDKNTDPDTTLTVPFGVLRFASKIIPKKAIAALEDKGIDLKKIVEVSYEEGIRGTLVEIEEHKKKEKIIISIE